ncbi:MAG TPA: RNA-binding cell elongation regulator Jag/EloR [Candidatus Limnocylindrales bacterium]|jgi:spoIIIJ-associated protein|nr:RNA-binding cell elongation regulator Jag/EloR [Candidatus Limnocylindrales bacterium]
MSVYREFTGKTVEEALRSAREAFGAELNDLDFEILTPGSRGVLGMGAEPARIVAAPRTALGGAAPKRDAAAAQPLPPPPPREDRPRYGDRDRDRGPRRDDRDRRPPRPEGDRPRPEGDRDRDRDRGPRRDERDRRPRPEGDRDRDRAPRPMAADAGFRSDAAPGGEAGRSPRRDDRERGPRREDRGRRPAQSALTASEAAEVAAARGSLAAERADLEAAEASPEALAAGQEILEELMRHLGFQVKVELETGDTSRLNVVGDGDEKDALGALIGRKGERLSALQHLVNLMLSRRMGGWTRVLVDVEDYRGRRERQLRDLAMRAAARVVETGKMLQLEPMPALERRWVHIALRENAAVATQSIGEEPNRRIVVLPREV